MIHVLCGEDAFLAATEEKRLIDSLVDPAWRTVNLAVLDGATAAPAEVFGAARTPSFFGDRVVIVRDCPWFTPVRRKKEEGGEESAGDAGAGKAAAELVRAGLPEGCHLLLVVPRALNRTLAATKALLAAAGEGKAAIQEFPGPDPYKPERTALWLVDHARSYGPGIERNAADLLVGRLGQDKHMLDHEVRKLSAYAAGRSVRADDVALLSPPGESDVFALLETVAGRRAAEASGHLRRLLVHDHPLKILATMATFVRAWLQIKLQHERGETVERVAAAIKWHPYRVQKALDTLRGWNAIGLVQALRLLAEAEQALKGSGLPDTLVMERLVARLVSI